MSEEKKKSKKGSKNPKFGQKRFFKIQKLEIFVNFDPFIISNFFFLIIC